MFSEEVKINHKINPECCDKTRNIYEKPILQRFDALDVQTGGTNVPEGNAGLLES